MYNLNNTLYTDQTDDIDTIKLLIQSDNIPRTLANDHLARSMLLQFNELMEKLQSSEERKVQIIKKLNTLKINTKNQIQSYYDQIQRIEEKREYLAEFLQLYKNNSFVRQGNIEKYFDSRKDVHEATQDMLKQLQDKLYKVPFTMENKRKQLADMEDDLKEQTHDFAWPLYPITDIGLYFKDQAFEKKYGIPHDGIQIKVVQGTPVYAARDGIVYQVSNHEGIGINWVLIAHSDGYTSAYIYVNKIMVQPGDVIRRGQLIGYSGGEPGTRGA